MIDISVLERIAHLAREGTRNAVMLENLLAEAGFGPAKAELAGSPAENRTCEIQPELLLDDNGLPAGEKPVEDRSSDGDLADSADLDVVEEDVAFLAAVFDRLRNELADSDD